MVVYCVVTRHQNGVVENVPVLLPYNLEVKGFNCNGSRRIFLFRFFQLFSIHLRDGLALRRESCHYFCLCIDISVVDHSSTETRAMEYM